MAARKGGKKKKAGKKKASRKKKTSKKKSKKKKASKKKKKSKKKSAKKKKKSTKKKSKKKASKKKSKSKKKKSTKQKSGKKKSKKKKKASKKKKSTKKKSKKKKKASKKKSKKKTTKKRKGRPITNDAMLERIRRVLLHKRAVLIGDVSYMEEEALRRSRQDASGDLSNVPLHMADIGSDTFEQELTLGLLENESTVIHDIDAALERMDEGRFGVCEECEASIGKPRLKALPYARLCVECQRSKENA